jgi:hypothetical protein
MKKLFKKLKDLLSDETDTWKNQSTNLPVQRIQAEQVNNQPFQSHGFSTFDWREQMVNNEFAAQNCTQEQQYVNVSGPMREGNIPCSHNNETFTENGLVSGRTEALLTTADGRLIKPEELHGGGRCWKCEALTNKIYFCAICKTPLCFHCVKHYKDLDVCERHLKELKFKEDTWNIENG